MKRYVLGFAIHAGKVLLIKKSRPDWQVDKYNGLGGKIEQDELAIQSMIREFHEESGIMTTNDNWHSYAILSGVDNCNTKWSVEVFTGLNIDVFAARNVTDEEVFAFPLDSVMLGYVNTLDNVPWLVNMCLHHEVGTVLNIEYL